jgi:adenine phosphoribosyltransferase
MPSNLDYREYIANIADFPSPGILYRDIQPLLADAHAFTSAIDDIAALTKAKPDYWVGIESRGFIIAAALAARHGGGIRLIRKKGKLPNANLVQLSYDLEYGSDTIEMTPAEAPPSASKEAPISASKDAPTNPSKPAIILVDDVYATGGTLQASAELCSKAGFQVLDKLCLLDIGLVQNHDVKCLITYP